jgi:hypothetical protein
MIRLILWLLTTLTIVAGIGGWQIADAQTVDAATIFPSKPVRLLIPAPPGTSVGIGAPVLVEAEVALAPADGQERQTQ